MGDEGTAHLFETTRRLIKAIRKSGIKCEGAELHLSEGPTSSLPHVLMQVLPRFEGDRLWIEARRSWDRLRGLGPRRLLWWEEMAARQLDDVWLPTREMSDEELGDVAARIRTAYELLWARDS